MKQCTKCNELKPLSEYRRDKQKKDGLHSHCKPCGNDSLKRWQQRQRELPIEDRRARHLKYTYGLSLDDFNRMWLEQDGCCAVCNEALSLDQNGYAVDHHHESGVVRGLLCKTCNQGIGLLKDNPRIILQAANYLLQSTFYEDY